MDFMPEYRAQLRVVQQELGPQEAVEVGVIHEDDSDAVDDTPW